MSTPAGWYPDPDADDGSQRWWDGDNWTEHRAPAAAPAPAAPSGGSSGPQWEAPPPAYGGPQGQQAPGGQQPGGVAAAQRTTNGKAIASLVLSIVWLAGLGSVLAIILGFMARGEIKQRGQKGNGLAVSGIVIGVLGLLGAAVFWAGVVFLTSDAADDLVQGADLTLVSQLQNAYQAEFGEFATSIEELTTGIDSMDNVSLETEGIDDIRIVRADADTFCAESTTSGDVRHIGEGGFVSEPGPCDP